LVGVRFRKFRNEMSPVTLRVKASVVTTTTTTTTMMMMMMMKKKKKKKKKRKYRIRYKNSDNNV